MTTTPNLGLSLLSENIDSKYLTHNAAILWADALLSGVTSRTTAAQPGSVTNGALYIMPASPTGTDWGAFSEHDLVLGIGGVWENMTPVNGLGPLKIKDETSVAVNFTGSTWEVFGGAGRSTGTFEDADLVDGVLTYTHSLGNRTPQVAISDGSYIARKPAKQTGTSTSVVTLDLKPYGTISGTWNITVIA